MLKVSMVRFVDGMKHLFESRAIKLKLFCCLSSQAIRILIQERLNPDAIAKASQAKEVTIQCSSVIIKKASREDCR